MNVELRNIINNLTDPVLFGSDQVRIGQITHDSRRVTPNALFVAIVGEKSDGHDYIDSVLSHGAAAILAEKDRPAGVNIPWIKVPSTKIAMGLAAAALYDFPSRKFKLVGITGTNGKTTLTYLLESIIKAHNGSPGIVGTISYRYSGLENDAAHTTPESSDLQKIFFDMANAGMSHVFIEASSHGLHRGRLAGCDFDMAVFTNLTQDHLDYHSDLEDYFSAKKILFERLLPASFKHPVHAIVNTDDHYGLRLIPDLQVPYTSYGLNDPAMVCPTGVDLSASGILGKVRTPRGEITVRSVMTGRFNISNILAAIAVSTILEIPIPAIEKGITALAQVPGRLERVNVPRGTVLVDYAHTPNALWNVVSAAREICVGKLITLMGCGGDRDRTKRPMMGSEAAKGSDFVIITSDNPRSENPLDIIAEIEPGIVRERFSKVDPEKSRFVQRGYTVIPDRRSAIRWALENIQKDDVLLIAGKGHETYQEIKGVRYPFDDRTVVREESANLEREKQPK